MDSLTSAHSCLQISTERPARNDTHTADLPSRSITIPTKYYHSVAGDQSLLRSIRSAGGSLAFPQPAPPRPTIARPATTNGTTSLAAKAARIDLDAEDTGADELVPEGDWEIVENYQDAPEGELAWVIKAKEDKLDKVQQVLDAAVERAKNATHSQLIAVCCGRCLANVIPQWDFGLVCRDLPFPVSSGPRVLPFLDCA